MSSSSRSRRNVECSVSGGAEQLLLAVLPLGAERRPRLLGERRRAAARRRARSPPGRRARAAAARGSSRRAAAGASRATWRGLGVRRERLLEQRVGDRLQRAPARAGHPRGLQRRARRRGRTPGPWPRASPAPARRAGASRGRGLLLAQPGVGDRGDRAGELARRGLRRAAHVVARRARRTWRGSPAARRPRWRRRTAAGGAGRAARSAGARRGPGRVVSSAPAAAAVELRKVAIRSRASGGICGDSIAATSAATMSSLRRRAICVQRARSIARSSIGGRASARTTAPASPGSTSSRSQASRSRTSARWKNAAAPDEPVGHGALLQRGRDRLALAAHRAHEHADVLGRDALARDQPLDVGGDRLRLRALVRAAPERDLARRRAGARQPLGDPVGVGRDDRVRRRRGRARPQRKRSRAARPCASGQSARKSATFFVEAPRKRWIAWSSSAATVRLPCSATSSRSSRAWAKFGSWKSSTSTWR